MHRLAEQLEAIMPTALEGSVAQTVGLTIAATGFPAPVGAVAQIHREAAAPLMAEVIGFRNELTLLYPLSDLGGIRHGNRIRLVRTAKWLRVGDGLLGRVIDASGRAVDGKPQPVLDDRVSYRRAPPHPCTRPRIDRPLATGVRAMDGLVTCGKGQRMGVFAGSGVGKSVLLGMMARYTDAEVIVISLVGERGREVNEFIQRDLGPQGLAKSVVVVATSDEPALVRVQAASTAAAIAEYYRDRGKDVLWLMDSVTRFALAQREIGLAAGEPPATRGYPPSVFAVLPKLVERAGRSPRGSITAFFTVLVEGDDPNEPVADAVRSLLDGHTWLSRDLAARGHYPAVDVLGSLSRLMPEVTTEEHRRAAAGVREIMAVYRAHEDLISIGAYRRGSNRMVDVAIEMQDELNRYLRQRVDQPCTLDEARAALIQLYAQAAKRLGDES
ncbi:MAG: FliI/YscN family ATPase [Thermoguttaceae bacterium]|jgi:flagellum-specific ATP synthase